MDGLSEEDRYDFDVMGWLRVPAVLGDAQIHNLVSSELSTYQHVEQHPHYLAFELATNMDRATHTAAGGEAAVPAAVNQLIETAPLPLLLEGLMAAFAGQSYELDGYQLVERPSDWRYMPAMDESGVWWPSRSWRQKHGFRWAQRLLAVFALESTDAVRLVRASHLAELPPTREALCPRSELWETLSLERGELLLCSAGVLSSIITSDLPLKLAVCDFIGPFVRPENPYLPSIPEPTWARRLSRTQRALLQHRWTDETANPPVLSDGSKSWVGTDSDTQQASAETNDATHLAGDPTEMYKWDLRGFLVLRNVMDQAWIERALASLEPRADVAIEKASVAIWNDDTPALEGTRRPDVGGLFELSPPDDAKPFLQMLDHPQIVQRLVWMLGPGFSCHQNTAICSVKGTGGQLLHAEAGPSADPGEQTNPHHLYEVKNGRTYCNKVNVAWQLTDVNEEDGGFVVVPGSQRASLCLPDSTRAGEHQRPVTRVPMKAGDVLLFLGNTVTHGAAPWVSDRPRRVAMLDYLSQHARLGRL